MSMHSPTLVPIRDSIATQLLKTVFVLYLVLVVTVTLLQLMARFALPRLIRQLADMARLNAERKGVTFICDIPETLPHIVYGDQKRLRQVLLHLLGNAVKFTEQGRVELRIAKKSIRNPKSEIFNSKISNLKFKIQDTGLGMTPEQIEHIFQPFWQAAPYQLHSEGAGLGLTISQQILRKMGAELHCSSTVGKGSIFWFNIEMPIIDTPITDVAEPLSERSSEYPSQETLTAALAALPADWLVILRQGAAVVDPEALMGIITRIRKRDFILADSLTRLMEDFDYDEILRLTEESV